MNQLEAITFAGRSCRVITTESFPRGLHGAHPEPITINPHKTMQSLRPPSTAPEYPDVLLWALRPPLKHSRDLTGIPRDYPHKAYAISVMTSRNLRLDEAEGEGTKAAKREAFILTALESTSTPPSRIPASYIPARANHVINPHD